MKENTTIMTYSYSVNHELDYEYTGTSNTLDLFKTRQKMHRLLLYKGSELVVIKFSIISHIYIDKKIVYINTFDNRSFIANHSMDELSRIMDEHFFRINRQMLISINNIQKIMYEDSQYIVEFKVPKGETALVSRKRISAFKHWIETAEKLP